MSLVIILLSKYTHGKCTHVHACSHKHTCTQTAPSGTPKWLTVGCSLPTSVQLSWGAVPEDQQNGNITGYSIQVEGPGTTRNIQTVYDQVSSLYSPMKDNLLFSTKKVSDLRPSTEYTFSVSAKTVAGSGPAISVPFVTPQEGKASLHISVKQ